MNNQFGESGRFFVFGNFAFDWRDNLLLRDGKPIKLLRKTTAVLRYLIQNRNRRVSKDELKKECWQGLNSIEDGSVDKQISMIRHALKPNGSSYIETRYGEGWQFVAEGTFQAFPTIPKPVPPFEGSTVEGAIRESEFRLNHKHLVLGAIMSVVGIVPAVGVWANNTPKAGVLQSFPLTTDNSRKFGPIVTDGRKIFFQEQFGDSRHTVSIPVSGGEAEPLGVRLPNDLLLWVSPNGSKLILLSEGQGEGKVWMFSRSSGQLRLLRGGVTRAAVSRDGLVLATSTGASLSVSAIYGSAESKTELSGAPEYLRWSQDGRVLRFSIRDFPGATTSSEWELNRENGRGRRLTRLSDGQNYVGAGDWSAAGRYFFYEGGTLPSLDIWVARESGWFLEFGKRSPQRLTAGEPGSWESPVTDPSDESTVFTINHYLRSELVRLDSSSRSWRPEWNASPVFELSYSRDGKWVAYSHLPDHSIWKAHPNGTSSTRLTGAGIEAHQPHWSPDGNQIAFMGAKANGQWRVFVVPAVGGIPQELIPAGEDQGVPTWSPDGRRIIFGERLSKKPRLEMAVHVLDLRSKTVSEMPGSRGLWSPRWSPDGKFILAITTDWHALRLVVSPELEWRELARMSMIDDATWSTDSRYIYFNGRVDTLHWSLFRLQVYSHKLERIVGLDTFDRPNENWFGVASDGSPLAIRGVPVDEIFKLKCRLP